jgi:hypothetical protein
VPVDWPFKPALKGDHVYHGFIITSLVDDHHERHKILTVPHDGEQEDRFKQAIRERNARIKLYGQPEILHACEKCVRFYPEEQKCSYSVIPLVQVIRLIIIIYQFLLS